MVPTDNQDTRRRRPSDEPEQPKIRVEDRRHWARGAPDETTTDGDAEPSSTQPTIVDEYRRRAEEAEARLREYIAAFKEAETEREAFRERLQRDVERRVELRLGELLTELLDVVDQLEIAVRHVEGIEAARPLAEGVLLVRDRFLTGLRRQGVEAIRPDGESFDPNVAEAVRLEPVPDADLDGKVTETVQPGYRLADLVLRPAKVAVGKKA